MMLVSMQDNNQTANAGADAVFLLCYTDTEWLAFISVARRITSIFSAEVFGVNYSSLYTGSLFSDFYEARAQENDQYYYVQLGSESKYCIALYKYNGMYIFVLTSLDLLDEIMGG